MASVMRLRDVVLVLILLRAEPQCAIGIPHQGQLHADERDPPDHRLAFQQRPRGEIDIGFGRLSDEIVLGVENARSQNDEIDPPLIARPFDGRLVVFNRDARERLPDRVGQRAVQGAQRDRSHQQPDHGPNHEKDDGRPDPAGNEGGMANVMGLDVLPKRNKFLFPDHNHGAGAIRGGLGPEARPAA